jgi:D-alanine transaminase
MKNLGYYNGRFGEADEMMIPMNDRVSFFGDGVYDATYSRNYKIFTLDEHIDRLYNSASLLEIKIKETKEEMKSILNEMVKKMDTGENFVYWQVTRGTGKRNHVFPEDSEGGNLWINIYPKNIVDLTNKVSLITMEDTRFFHCNIKTLNLIPSVIASQRAKEAGAFETVFHRNGRVTECAHSNVHIIKDGVFKTAPLDNLILPGITRGHLIRTCNKLGIPVKEEAFNLEELFDADEIIVSSAGALCVGAKELDGKNVGGRANDLYEAIKKEMLDEFYRETDNA